MGIALVGVWPVRTSPSSILRCARGTSAVEFAIIGPIFLVLVFGLVCFGVIFATYSGVQQLAAEAARASVAGLDATERDQIARTYVVSNAGAYAMLDPTKLSVTTTTQPGAFQVLVTYDLSASPVFSLSKLIPMPSPVVRRAASIGT